MQVLLQISEQEDVEQKQNTQQAYEGRVKDKLGDKYQLDAIQQENSPQNFFRGTFVDYVTGIFECKYFVMVL